MAESMVFYRSFYEALEGLSIETRVRVLDAILRYGLYEDEPDLKGVESSLFCLIRPQIDANTERRENGKKGGRPKKPSVSKSKTIGFENENHRLFNSEPNVNVNVNVNENENVNANANANGLNAPSSSRAYARGGEENPDDDADLRHEDDGRTYFEPKVKVGMIPMPSEERTSQTGHKVLTHEERDKWTKRAQEYARAHRTG